MKIGFHYFSEGTLIQYRKNGQQPNINTVITTVIDTIRHFDQLTFDGYVYEQGIKLTKNAYDSRIYSYLIDYKENKKGYLTSDGKIFYRIISFNFDENNYIIISLKKEELFMVQNKVQIQDNPKKIKKRKYISPKIRALLQKEINSKCPIPSCNSEEVQLFEIHHIDGNIENNNIENLILICPTCHAKIEKGDISEAKVKEIKYGLAKTEKNLTAIEIAELENEKIERKNNSLRYLKSKEALNDAKEEVRKLFKLLEDHCEQMKKYKNVAPAYTPRPDWCIQITAKNVYIVLEFHNSFVSESYDLTCTFNEAWHIRDEPRLQYEISRFKFDIDDANNKGWSEYDKFYTTENLADHLLSELMEHDKRHPN